MGPFPGPQNVVPEGASAPEVWDSIPFLAKLQIIGAIGVLEHISEDKNFLAADGMKHYMRGGKPGYFPTFSANVHPMPLNLFDPFKWSKNASPEKKAKGLVTETNNGRPAMLGLFGFLSESKIPGSVPALSGIIPSYDGDYMQPFSRAREMLRNPVPSALVQRAHLPRGGRRSAPAWSLCLVRCAEIVTSTKFPLKK